MFGFLWLALPQVESLSAFDRDDVALMLNLATSVHTANEAGTSIYVGRSQHSCSEPQITIPLPETGSRAASPCFSRIRFTNTISCLFVL